MLLPELLDAHTQSCACSNGLLIVLDNGEGHQWQRSVRSHTSGWFAGLYHLLGGPVIRSDSALCVIWMLQIECNLQVVPGADESR